MVCCGGYGRLAVAALDDFYIMVGAGHNGFLLPVVDWMGWGGGLPPYFGQKKSRKPFLISCSVVPLVGGYYLVTFLYQT